MKVLVYTSYYCHHQRKLEVVSNLVTLILTEGVQRTDGIMPKQHHFWTSEEKREEKLLPHLFYLSPKHHEENLVTLPHFHPTTE